MHVRKMLKGSSREMTDLREPYTTEPIITINIVDITIPIAYFH